MLTPGTVVRSVAGHDKNKFYCIVECLGDQRVSIADGKIRKLEKPKIKNIRHIRPTTTILDLEVVTTNKKLKAALAPWNREADGEQ